MDIHEAIRLIRNLPTMCEFTDAYGEPIDSDAYYEAVDMAISALQAQDLQPTCKELATDTISRQAAIDALRTCYDTETISMDNGDEYINYGDAVGEMEQLPSAQPEIVRCKGCKYVGTDATCCLVCNREGMGLKPYHVRKDDYCSYAERRTDGVQNE